MIGHPARVRREQASLWVARMDAGGWSDADEVALQAWLDADPLCRGALLQAQAAWITLDPTPASAAEEGSDTSHVQAWTRRRALIAGGGSVLAASLAGGAFWLGSGTAYTTELGEVRRVRLADGSSAAINTSSRLDVRYANAMRKVLLDRGEAWFQVARDTARPFVVEAGPVRVQAVGTAFSVRRREHGAEVLVTEGVVEAWVSGAEAHRIRLTVGQRAYLADNTVISREPTAPSTIDRALAWRGGKIDLLGEPLAGAITEFNRYNRRRITLVDPALAGEQLDGVFRIDDPEGFALAIRSSLEVPVDLSNPDEIRIGRAPN